jgi:hypothetical protein
MNEETSIVRLRQPDEIDDPLTALLRSGARQLLEQAIEAEVAAFLAARKDLKLADGRDRLVRHGHGPERVIQTGIGPVEVQRVKVRDRAPDPAAERIRFRCSTYPKFRLCPPGTPRRVLLAPRSGPHGAGYGQFGAGGV